MYMDVRSCHPAVQSLSTLRPHSVHVHIPSMFTFHPCSHPVTVNVVVVVGVVVVVVAAAAAVVVVVVVVVGVVVVVVLTSACILTLS
jgi:hypothetical protein